MRPGPEFEQIHYSIGTIAGGERCRCNVVLIGGLPSAAQVDGDRQLHDTQERATPKVIGEEYQGLLAKGMRTSSSARTGAWAVTADAARRAGVTLTRTQARARRGSYYLRDSARTPGVRRDVCEYDSPLHGGLPT